jgi:DNA-binding NarL/FixJ family response regulator
VATQPDVVVTDVHLAEGNGIDAIREIASLQPGARVLVLTEDSDDGTLLAALQAGALGYLLKSSRSGELARAIRLTAAGRSVIDPGVADLLWQSHPPVSQNPFARLTQRERTVLASVATGKTNAEIAEELHFSERTIKNVVSQAMVKLGAKRRSEAAALFVRHVEPGSLGSFARS